MDCQDFIRALDVFAGLFGIAGSVLLALPFILRQGDRDALELLTSARTENKPESALVGRLGDDLAHWIQRKATRDYKHGIRGCIALGVAFVLLLISAFTGMICP